MEEKKAQAFHDELSLLVSKRGKSGGLGLGGGRYSWSVNNVTTSLVGERSDGLPNNPLYVHFVREGSFDAAKSNHGDGRTIKRNFDDCNINAEQNTTVSSSSNNSVVSKDIPKKEKLTKEQKRAAKLEAKKQAKIAEKKAAKLLEKRVQRELEEMKNVGQKNKDTEEVQPKQTPIVDPCPQKIPLEETKPSEKKLVKRLKKSKEKKDKSRLCGGEEGTADSDIAGRKRKDRNGTADTVLTKKKKQKQENKDTTEAAKEKKKSKKQKKKKS